MRCLKHKSKENLAEASLSLSEYREGHGAVSDTGRV